MWALVTSDVWWSPANTTVSKKNQDVSMNHPLWMLAPWAILAVAAGIKFWRLTALFRRHLGSTGSSTERFRESLERVREHDQQRS